MKPPIADPFAPPETFPAGEIRVFRIHFWRVYRGNVLIMLLLLPLLVLGLWFSASDLFAWLLSGFGAAVLFFHLFLYPLSMTFGTSLNVLKVNRSGVQVAALRGFHEWSHIKSVHPVWFGLPYLRLKLQGQWFKIWVPLALRDTKGFARAVEEWAPEGNPLREWLKANQL